jgi:phage tail-like protein
VSALEPISDVIECREGKDQDTRRIGRTKFEAVTLEHGITHDLGFINWANADAKEGTKLRKDLVIGLYDEARQPVAAYNLCRCWVPQIQVLPDLNPDVNVVAIEKITLEHEGWQLRSAAPT